MIRGVDVTVLRPNPTGRDRLNNVTYGEPVREPVRNVLIDSPNPQDMEAARQDGVTLALTLRFPKGYSASLRGCSVELPAPYGGTYRVVGDPKPLLDANCPTQWHMDVNVEVAHG